MNIIQQQNVWPGYIKSQKNLYASNVINLALIFNQKHFKLAAAYGIYNI